MSTPFPLEDAAQRQGNGNTWDPWAGPVKQPFFKGLGVGDLVTGLGSGAAKGVALLAGAGYGLATGDIYANPEDEKDLAGAQELIEQDSRERIKALSVDPTTQGAASQILHGLGEMGYLVTTGGMVGGPVGGAALVGGAEAKSTYQEAKAEGRTTAGAEAAFSGVTSAAGAFLPAGVGSTLASKLITGAVGNVGFGMLNRYGDHLILESGGYHDMAEQQKVLDGTQMLADLFVGAGFGGIAHLHGAAAEKIRAMGDSQGVEDAARVTILASADRQASPGVPVDPAAAAAHSAALQTAGAQLMADRPIDVTDSGVSQADFARRAPRDLSQPAALLMDAIRNSPLRIEEEKLKALEDQYAEMTGQKKAAPAPAVPREAAPINWTKEIEPSDRPLSDAQRAIETRFTQQIGSNYEAAKAAYAAIPDAQGGKVLNTDTARELSPDYLRDRTQSAAVHEPASALVRKMYAEALQQPPKPGEDNAVFFLGGGTGAGKSTGLTGELGAAASRAQIVYDTNLADAGSAIKKINQALAVGKDVRIAYVYRDPTDALVAGALTRATRQEREFGSGRTVPVKDHIETHVNSNSAIRKIAKHFEGNEKVQIGVVDNTHGKGNQVIIPLEKLPKLEYNSTHEQVLKALDDQFAARKISPAVYRGFAGREPPGGLAASATALPEPAAPGLAKGLRGEPGAPGARGNANPVVFTAAGRAVEVKPKIVEAKDLVTSDQAGYPQEIQPRQRGTRKASAAQVASIAQNLNPELLGESATADTGAPITGPDNAVESGNGRVMALRDVYANNPERAQAYRDFLESKGYSTKGMKEPVLVRERVTPMSPEERQAFAVEANKPTAARFSPVEQAQADAVHIDSSSLALLRPSDLSSVQNATFVRSFMARIPESERGALVNPDGSISQEGVRRIQGAILAKAYGGSPDSNATLGRMLESTDPDMRSTIGALMDAAPAFAKLRQAIADGKIGGQYDLSRALTEAVETVGRVRGEGQALNEFLAQGDMLTRRSPAVVALMRTLYDAKGERIAGREKVATSLMNYADQAIKQRLDQGMLFGDPPIPPEQLLGIQQAKEAEAAKQLQPAGDMFGLKTVPLKREALSAADLALKEQPNMEIPTDSGEVERARAELMAADEGVEKTEERAPTALETAANCFGIRGAA